MIHGFIVASAGRAGERRSIASPNSPRNLEAKTANEFSDNEENDDE
jgi:hypothetical protein